MASFSKKIIFSLGLFTAPLSAFSPAQQGQILYFVHCGEEDKALKRYLEVAREEGKHDYSFLQQIAHSILEKGSLSEDDEVRFLCLFGAGVSSHPSLIPLLEKGLKSTDMKHQLVALQFLARYQDDDANYLFQEALNSPFLITRLEALVQLAERHDPHTMEYLQSLWVKVPKLARPIFPLIVSSMETADAKVFLKQLLADSEVAVRLESILQIGEHKHDDLLPQIRKIALQPDPVTQEGCLNAFGKLKDGRSLEVIEKYTTSPSAHVRVAAHQALVALGNTKAIEGIEKEAKEGNLFAIGLLPKSSIPFLEELLKSEDLSIRLNAINRLLQFGELKDTSALLPFLIKDTKEWGYLRVNSPGKTLHYWKVIPHASQNQKTYPLLLQHTARLRLLMLRLTLELPEDDFIHLAKTIFDEKQKESIPLVMELLINKKTPKALELLKTYANCPYPFLRTYCNLALFRLKEEGPFEAYLLKWLKDGYQQTLISFKEEEDLGRSTAFTLNPEESSQLLIEIFETLASTQTPQAIEALVQAMAYGNPKNRYALAGLLLRTSE